LGVPFSAAASSFALAFLFDLIALAPMIAIAALAAGASTGLSAPVLVAGGIALAVVTGAILFALPHLFHLVAWFLDRLVTLTRGRFVRWKEAWAAAEEDIRIARRSGIYFRMLVLSILVRVAKYGSLYVFLYALINPLGYGFPKLPVPRVFLGLCSAELAASLPISGIAGFGAYEGAWALVFQLLGFPADIAKLTSISHHLFTQVYGYSVGALALALLLLPVFKRDRMVDRQPWRPITAWRFYARVAAASAAVLALLGLAYRAF
ncbi:MAG: flippase-like domain-containing protein, partial [Kiritimatiellae bacterium]|nr:flippase-like domain-containing protein [Kiritimatiellia bacterium]